MRPLALATIVLMFLSACSIDVAPISGGELFRGLPSPSGTSVSLTARQCQIISKWLESHDNGWSRTPASYVPELTARLRHANSTTTDIMVLRDSVVVSHDGKQYIRNFASSELSGLRSLLDPVP